MDETLDSLGSALTDSAGGAIGAAVQSFAAAFPTFATHVGVTLAILIVATFIYGTLTPHRELRLIRAGNTAAAISFGGAIVSLSIPLSVCMAYSLNWADILIWGVVTVLLQLFALRWVDIFLRDLPRRIADGETSAATLLVAVKLALSVILAAAVSGAPLARL